MVLKKGEKVLVMTRRLLESTPRAHVVGVVQEAAEGLARIECWAYVWDRATRRFESRRNRTWYDPIYEHDRWQHRRTEPRWEERERDEYDRRRRDRDLRPPRTYREMETRAARAPEPQRRHVQVARPLTVVIAAKTTPLAFVQVNVETRKKIARQAADVRSFRDKRNRWESPTERREPVRPPTERREPVTPPRERRGREPVRPPTERREPVTPPRERREPVTPPDVRRDPVDPPTGDRPRVVPPRAVRLTRPKRVKVPARPIVGRPGARGPAEKGPPTRPGDKDERKRPDKGARGKERERKDD